MDLDIRYVGGIVVFLFIMWAIFSFRPRKSFGGLIESFNPYLDYSRVYPGTFAFTGDFGVLGKSYYMYPDGIHLPPVGGNVRYSPGYRDYYYIPSHEYMKQAMGRGYNHSRGTGQFIGGISAPVGPYKAASGGQPAHPPMPSTSNSSCVVPPRISEYCVHNQINQNGNLDQAIRSCVVPSSVSESCASF